VEAPGPSTPLRLRGQRRAAPRFAAPPGGLAGEVERLSRDLAALARLVAEQQSALARIEARLAAAHDERAAPRGAPRPRLGRGLEALLGPSSPPAPVTRP
jgi:hypothetical protein